MCYFGLHNRKLEEIEEIHRLFLFPRARMENSVDYLRPLSRYLISIKAWYCREHKKGKIFKFL